MIFCPKCGAAAEDGTLFCAQCGNAMRESQPLAEVQPPVASYQQAQPQYQQPQHQAQQAPYQPPVYQTVYQQPVYTQPAEPTVESNGPGTAGMVLGIIAMALTCVGLLCCVSLYGAIFGFILMIIAMILTLPGIGLSIGGVAGHRKASKGKAIAGLVLNGLLVAIWFILIVAGGEILKDFLYYYM